MTTEVHSPNATKLTVLYNGRTAQLHYAPHETVGTLLQRALHHFDIHGAGDELALFTIAGAELPDGQTLAGAGVGPGEELILRQRVVRGGRL
jgi:hypothetical protein